MSIALKSIAWPANVEEWRYRLGMSGAHGFNRM